MKYYLNNPLSNNGVGVVMPGVELIDATTVDYPSFFAGLGPDDEVVLIGGDGTINYFINHVDVSTLSCRISFIGHGSGNDFLRDINEPPGKELSLDPYLKRLPTVRVDDGRAFRFINNMGFGIDGYVSDGSDKFKAAHPGKKLNYTKIALKGLLYDFKPYHVWLEIDGEKHEYDNVWMAPAMKGRLYGGGMMAAPDQDRSTDHLTVVICSCRSRLRLLKTFPQIFKGTHTRYTDMIKVFTGQHIHVRFSAPCAAMIDGETIPNVTEYWAEW